MSHEEHLREFGGLVAALCATFRAEASEALIEGYWLALGHLPPDAWRRGIRRAIAECEHMPRPAELRQLSGEVTQAMRGLRAFESLRAALQRVGTYRSVDFGDPALHATVRSLGGWVAIGRLPAADFESFFRERFLKAYEQHCRHSVPPEPGAHLPGIAEGNNVGRFEVEPPVRFSLGGRSAPALRARRELGGGDEGR